MRLGAAAGTPNPNESGADDAELHGSGRTSGVGGAHRRRLGRDSDGGGQGRGAGCGGGGSQGRYSPERCGVEERVRMRTSESWMRWGT